LTTSDREQWLERLYRQSLQDEAAFLQNIARRLGRAEPLAEPPRHPFRGAPDFWREHSLSAEDNIALFMANWTGAGGHAIRLPDLRAAGQYVADLARERGARSLVCQNEPELLLWRLDEALPDHDVLVWAADRPGRLEAAAKADIGVVMAEYAAAHTGSIVVTSSPDKGRSVSLLPDVLVAVVPVERLHTKMGDFLARFAEMARERMPAGIHFISGPSRSADIENDLTIGVHGPGVVHALLVG
jgi:L-lactate dehydrogenase complex protein LldG